MSARLVFWGSLGLLAYTYAGYPAVLAVASKVARRPWRKADRTPPVTLLIAAWNEAAVIEKKLENALELDYPAGALEIMVASDGSSDDTVARARRFEDRGVRVLDLPRGGKTATLNRALDQARGELIVFSDANVFFAPDAIRKLVRHFADPQIGGVSGDVRLVEEGFSLGQSQSLYYRYERWIQTMESAIGSMVGADGGMYALRKGLIPRPPAHIINDDFVLSMEVACRGARVVYDPEAVAWESSPADANAEMKRKIRVEQGNFQALFSGWGVPGPDQPWLLFTYVSHKVLRWTAFVPMTGAAVSSSLLAAGSPLYAAAASAQGLFYLLAAAGIHAEGHGGPILKIPAYFCLENLAAVRGLGRLLTGRRDWGHSRAPASERSA